ncbi:ty1-copia retrotransposon protein [Cucumis melo var. makuwa]|uniref:Ty1-copia retrotransposon protein n=1 Tax=Cucumis melo var. makuwa TaxID=1194695 RepID=A0A5A7T9C8_CUCMM|nr:ty1-copia retrotransposon protein [Cucumis melo var. makuwa]
MSIKTSNKILPDLSKLEPLDGTNYRRWSKKLLIFFEQLEVDYVLTTDLPSSDPSATTSTSSNPESSTGPSTSVAVIDQRKGRPSQKPTPQANLAEQDSEIIAAIVEVNLIENKTDWILDTGASRYFCTNRELLHDYEDTTDGECVSMKNLTTAGVIGKGKGEAVLSVCFVLNKIPHKRLDKTPYELWKGYAPNLSYLKVWGCLAKVPFPALKKSTVGSKTFDCIFIGETPVSETVNTSNLRCELELRRSKRQRIEKSFGLDFLSTFIVKRRDEIDCNFTNLYLIDEDPKTYQEALNSVESSMWKEAIKSELDSLVMNHTWDLVDLPMGNKLDVSGSSKEKQNQMDQ